jgi:hypothetical protein
MLILVFFVLNFYFLTKLKYNSDKNKVEVFINSIAFFFIQIYLITEIFSLFNLLSTFYSDIYWIISSLILYRKIKYINIKNDVNEIIITIKNYKTISFIILIISIIGIYTSPNTWDSMTYHLPRVMHWKQNLNVYPYSTDNIRQIIHPPFMEYILLQINLITNVDYFFNFLNSIILIGILFLINNYYNKYKNIEKRKLILLSYLSIPMILFQANSTQTDLLATFILLLLLILFEIVCENKIITFFDILKISILIGIGTLTKYTFTIFLMPFLIYFALRVIKFTNKIEIIKYVFLSILIIGIILGPFFFRNFIYAGNILGDTHTSSIMTNKVINLKNMLSNMSKIISDNLALPINYYNNILLNITKFINNIFGGSLNNIDTNFGETEYIIKFYFNEDVTGHFIGTIAIIIAIVITLYKKVVKYRKNIILSILGLIIYSLIFRWQIWGARLYLPIFSFLVLNSMMLLIEQVHKKYILNIIKFLFLSIIGIIIIFNPNKPFINFVWESRNLIKKPRGIIPEREVTFLNGKFETQILNKYYNKFENEYRILNNLNSNQLEFLFNYENKIGLFNFEKNTILNTNRLEQYFLFDEISYHNLVKSFSVIPKNINNLLLNIGGETLEYPIFLLKDKYINKNVKIYNISESRYQIPVRNRIKENGKTFLFLKY